MRPLEGVERDGDDLSVRTALTMTEAALGSTVSVPTPDGPLEVELAPGTQPGASTSSGDAVSRRSRRAGAGIFSSGSTCASRRGSRGEQRAELLRLEEELGDDAYRDDDGFIGRLRERVPLTLETALLVATAEAESISVRGATATSRRRSSDGSRSRHRALPVRPRRRADAELDESLRTLYASGRRVRVRAHDGGTFPRLCLARARARERRSSR